jgi:coenzyme PQQ precursor peptide PqqA
VRASRACALELTTGGRRPPNKEAVMQWNTPKIVEIACGGEINAYFPADL